MKIHRLSLLIGAFFMIQTASALGKFGDWTCSVALSSYISDETGKAPNAYMWVADSTQEVRFAVLAQQNMTEEALLRNPRFRQKMARLGGALIWVAPWFSRDWSPLSASQQVFEEMMAGLAGQSGHPEIVRVPIVPFGHSAQATFPWNFAAWNPQRTLSIISFHGDAPRTNLCGYGAANIEWGRTRHIDGIPGLMIEGEYEWWQARVLPALAFRLMYPKACVSFLCDTGCGHFELCDETIDYISLFIEKACHYRLTDDGSLRSVNPEDGWLYGVPVGGDKEGVPISTFPTSPPAPWHEYRGDPHEAFWYFDEEMAKLTAGRYAATDGKRFRYVGIRYNNRLVEYDRHQQGGMQIDLSHLSVGDRFQLQAVAVDSSRTRLAVEATRHIPHAHIDYICGPVRKVSADTFEIIPYDCGSDNPRRCRSVWLAAVIDGDKHYKRAVQPICIKIGLQPSVHSHSNTVQKP